MTVNDPSTTSRGAGIMCIAALLIPAFAATVGWAALVVGAVMQRLS